MKHYELSVPEGYMEVKTVDAKKGKFALWLNVAAILVGLVVFVAAWLVIFKTQPISEVIAEKLYFDYSWQLFVRMVVLLAVMVAYIILHELVHGAVYKMFTKQKLTFGFSFSVAYCGVPNIYVYRTAALFALLSPFIVFDIVFLVPMFFFKHSMDVLLCAIMLSVHVGGCVGDLYVTGLFAFCFRDKTTLMRDTGPVQTFFVREDSHLGRKILAQQVVPAEIQEPQEPQDQQ